MDGLKLLINALAAAGENIQIAFAVWCIKELLVYLVFPLVLCVVGIFTQKILRIIIEAKEKGIFK
jgi:hypothetical protein